MTLSELARIAEDEKKVMYVRRKAWRQTRHAICLHGRFPFVFRAWLEDLLEDDWYEVKE